MTAHDERMTRFREAGLYLVTFQSRSLERTTLTILEAALRGGVRLVQLREKDMPLRELYAMAIEARRMTREAGALLIINDRLDVALAVGADGVHLGQDDLPISAGRELAPDLIIGASTHSAEEAAIAIREGASYVNIGPVFPTTTKECATGFLGLDGLREVAATVTVPFTVMGGIKQDHIPQLIEAGAETIALVTAVTEAADVEGASRDLLSAIRSASLVR
ncbi:MAG: thiamine phosphate synthase [Kiritimatiellia bacterium]|jgi:thiamine-phosphate pyrophosphorylase|nr:thiamine phosphate synthase [Kiritimatiellia bacterium]MDP6630209.1 thiamine phosphate synthase [Kiritimatiellia bacterium]MDP6810703.1 thiamine phosphate synthase [Kiritimatiellia bacterium]MDP7023310.1 thiamine phosphate synthase [Kiritimatiellia bacterium]